jgi:transcriptional regulator with XRE-family HTH domain
MSERAHIKAAADAARCTLSARLLDRINAAGTNPSRLSEDAGLGRTAVRDILSGKSNSPSVDTIVALAQVLGCSVAYLIGEVTDALVKPVHTDLPWEISRSGLGVLSRSGLVADCSPIPYHDQPISEAEAKANAALIVRAVNSLVARSVS